MNKVWEDILKQFRDIRARVNKLETWEPFSNSAPLSTNDVTNPPSDAELDAAFGDAASLALDPYIAIIDDAGATTTVWLCVATNGAWFYTQLTKAV